MKSNDDVCLCYHVAQEKIVNFLKRENPPVASLISECLGAGTGCGWCIPYLKRLHQLHLEGEEPQLPFNPAEYAQKRLAYHKDGSRPDTGDLAAPPIDGDATSHHD